MWPDLHEFLFAMARAITMPTAAGDASLWTICTPTQAEIEKMKRIGLEPGAAGYDESGRLVCRRPDGTLEALATPDP